MQFLFYYIEMESTDPAPFDTDHVSGSTNIHPSQKQLAWTWDGVLSHILT